MFGFVPTGSKRDQTKSMYLHVYIYINVSSIYTCMCQVDQTHLSWIDIDVSPESSVRGSVENGLGFVPHRLSWLLMEIVGTNLTSQSLAT